MRSERPAWDVGRDTTIKFRVDDALVEKLDRVAKAKGDRSKALRYAIEVAERELERDAAIDRLVAQAEEDQRQLKGRKPPRPGPWRVARG